jgi:hypothetical protein
MATSILDLLDAIDAAVSAEQPIDCRDAVATLGQAQGVLRKLTSDGLDARVGGDRETAANSLAVLCGVVGAMWESAAARCSSLVGVLGDTIGRLHDELTQSDRWATAIRIAPIARKCAIFIEGSGPYTHVPELKALVQSAAEVQRVATGSPPHPNRCLGLSRPIPLTGVPAGIPPSEVAYEAMAEIVDHLSRTGRDRLTVRQMTGVCRAAVSVAVGVEQLAPECTRGTASSDAWRAARQGMSMFEDGHRCGPEDRVLLCAARSREAMARLRAVDPDALTPEDIAAVQQAGHLLPGLASSLDLELRIRRRSLIVPVGERPLHDGRIGEWLKREPFLATRDDVSSALRALVQAERTSATMQTRHAPVLAPTAPRLRTSQALTLGPVS